MKAEKNINLPEEDILYIHSEDFISRFGDWEKANRLEKLMEAEPIIGLEKIVFNRSDIGSTIEILKENKDRKGLQTLEKEIGKTILGTYQNDDTGIFINISNRNVMEISNHHYFSKEHIKSISYIPEIIKKAIFIEELENEDKKKHPNIEKYLYFGTGLKFSGVDYTCKSVIGVDSNKNCYYDQSLSTIKKENLIDYALQNKKAGNLSPLITQRETGFEGNKMPYAYYDKMLINICQVPQMPYLEKVNNRWQPAKESIKAVKAGKLYVKKIGQEYRMIDVYSNLDKEDISYIHSEDFISRFGDWEKANRLEKLMEAEPLFLNKKIRVFGTDKTEEINKFRKEKNIKELIKIVTNISQEMIQKLRFEQNLTPGESPTLTVDDSYHKFYINISVLKDVAHHNLFQKGHIEGICNIPEIVKNAIYIGKEDNEDKRKPELRQFYYFAEGIKIENLDFTAKIVFTKNNNGEFFYDQSLSTIEKGRFFKSIKKLPEVLNQINRLEYSGHSDEISSKYYDKRLINICQVPQMPYLEKVNNRWQPTKESIKAVKAGKLYVKKIGQEYRMIDNENNLEKIQSNIFFTYNDFNFVSVRNFSEEERTFVDSVISNEQNGKYEIYKDGIRTTIGKDKKGKFVVSGFNFNDTKQEAADAIKSVNALYGYAPEFLGIYAQVGAVASELNIHKENSAVNENIPIKKIMKITNPNKFEYDGLTKSIRSSSENEVVKLQKALTLALEKNVSPLKEVELNRENWNKMFPDGTVETPIATVKLGENQFDKLCRSDRNNLLVAMYETLSNPAIVLEKETLDEKSGEFKPVNIYGKSFFHEDSNHKRAVESVIIFKEGKNIVIGTYNKNIKDFVKQIKTAEQIIYADSEISRVASLILQNGGSHVRLHDAISNRAINSHYDKNNLLSINNLQFSESKNNLKKSIQFEYDGLSYIPVRSLSENEKDLMNNRSPKEYWNNSIIEKPKNGENYSIEDFKRKSPSKNADLFYCIERGKFFAPVENGIINLNEGSIDGHFREELINFYNNENVQSLIKNHRPLVFNEKEDISLMKNITSVLSESEVFYKNNETLGDVRIRFGNPNHNGLSHIIKRRMDKLIKHEEMSYDDAVKETSAILFLSLQNISNAPATKETNGRYAIYKNGIKTAIDTDKNGRFIVTGFDFNDTKQEAADAIKSVNALYGYAPEFLDIYAQVGAAYASLSNNITQQNSTVNEQNSKYKKILFDSAEINVNGTMRHCKNGLIKGFENAVSHLDNFCNENSKLRNENLELKKQLCIITGKCEELLKENKDLNNLLTKNKTKSMGM